MKHNYQQALGDIYYDISLCVCAVYNSGEIFIQKAQKYFFHFMWRSEICWESYRSNFESWYVIVNCLHGQLGIGNWNVPRRSSLFAMAANGTNHIVEKKIFLSTFVQVVTVTPTLFVNIYFLNSISQRLPKLKLTTWQSLTCFSCLIFRRKEF